jgi:hypothetical protein
MDPQYRADVTAVRTAIADVRSEIAELRREIAMFGEEMKALIIQQFRTYRRWTIGVMTAYTLMVVSFFFIAIALTS